MFREPAVHILTVAKNERATLPCRSLHLKLGDEAFVLLQTVADRLETHDHRAVALAYLRERLRHRNEPGDGPA